MDVFKELQQKFGSKVAFERDISVYLTLRTQTKAQYYLTATTKEDIIDGIKTAKQLGIPFLILGGGSNIAVCSSIIEGLVIHNRYIKKEIIEDTSHYTDILFSSGYPMSRVVKETTESGLSGFEYHLGLPGTIGGAIVMNSKWTKPLVYCGDVLLRGEIANHNGEHRIEEHEYFQFAYDYSILQDTKEVFLEGVFRLQKEEPAILIERSQGALQYRKETQPFGVATGGCFFQNISQEEQEKNNLPTTSAGYLIDHAGLKGKQLGAFVVSDIHANFIINTGEGKPEDLKSLLELIKTTVKKRYNVELEEEVVII